MIIGIAGFVFAVLAMLFFVATIIKPIENDSNIFYALLILALLGYIYDPYGFSVAKDFVLSWPMVG